MSSASSSQPSLQPTDHHDIINGYLQRLRVLGIDVHPRDKDWSPSNSMKKGSSDNLAGLVKYLYYKQNEALREVIGTFEARAETGVVTIADASLELNDLKRRGLEKSITTLDISFTEKVRGRLLSIAFL
jgi:hypothetical protein